MGRGPITSLLPRTLWEGLIDFLKQVGPEGRVSHRSKKGPKSGRKTGSLLYFRANILEENHVKETCLLSKGAAGEQSEHTLYHETSRQCGSCPSSQQVDKKEGRGLWGQTSKRKTQS